jgi:hypothetical protein
MKKLIILLSLLLTSTLCFALGDGVTVDKEKCTITKKGKTFPLYGEIHLVESEGLADLVVYVTKSWSNFDLDVYISKNNPDVDECGGFYITEYLSDSAINVYVTEWEDYADITVYIENHENSSGFK